MNTFALAPVQPPSNQYPLDVTSTMPEQVRGSSTTDNENWEVVQDPQPEPIPGKPKLPCDEEHAK